MDDFDRYLNSPNETRNHLHQYQPKISFNFLLYFYKFWHLPGRLRRHRLLRVLKNLRGHGVFRQYSSRRSNLLGRHNLLATATFQCCMCNFLRFKLLVKLLHVRLKETGNFLNRICSRLKHFFQVHHISSDPIFTISYGAKNCCDPEGLPDPSNRHSAQCSSIKLTTSEEATFCRRLEFHNRLSISPHSRRVLVLLGLYCDTRDRQLAGEPKSGTVSSVSDAAASRPLTYWVQATHLQSFSEIFSFLQPSELFQVAIVCKQFCEYARPSLSCVALSEQSIQKLLKQPEAVLPKAVSNLSTVRKLSLNWQKMPLNCFKNEWIAGSLANNLVNLQELNATLDLNHARRACRDRIIWFINRIIDNSKHTLKSVEIECISDSQLLHKICSEFHYVELRGSFPQLTLLRLEVPFKVSSKLSLPRCTHLVLKDTFRHPFEDLNHDAILLIKAVERYVECIQLSGRGRKRYFSTHSDFCNLNVLSLGTTTLEELTVIESLMERNMPELRQFQFIGPIQGFTDLHLKIFGKLHAVSHRGVEFNHRAFGCSFASLMHFRCTLSALGLFVLQPGDSANAHHMAITGMERDGNPHFNKQMDVIKKRNRVKSKWSEIFLYKKLNFKALEAFDVAQQASSFSIAERYRLPIVGPGMRGFDLFCLEMSWVPVLIEEVKNFSLDSLWKKLTAAQRESYDGAILSSYLLERREMKDWSFEALPAFWNMNSKGSSTHTRRRSSRPRMASEKK